MMGYNPSHFKGDNLPVEDVAWDDATEFCKRLSQKTGRMYHLPTESEWECACRAGTTTPFALGETSTPELVNYNKFHYGGAAKGTDRCQTTPVGSLDVANGFGLYDMHGNVEEWCQDWYHENYNGVPGDGSAWESVGRWEFRMLRGGSARGFAEHCRSAYRDNVPPSRSIFLSGLRVVSIART